MEINLMMIPILHRPIKNGRPSRLRNSHRRPSRGVPERSRDRGAHEGWVPVRRVGLDPLGPLALLLVRVLVTAQRLGVGEVSAAVLAFEPAVGLRGGGAVSAESRHRESEESEHAGSIGVFSHIFCY